MSIKAPLKRGIVLLIGVLSFVATAPATAQENAGTLDISARALSVSARTVANDDWVLISIAADPGSPGTVAALFGDDLAASDMGTTWTMFRWRPPGSSGNTAPGYQELNPQSRLYAGQAYWFIQITGAAVSLTLPTSLNATPTQRVRGCESIAGCFSIDLKADPNLSVSWNMVGLSQPRPIDLSQLRVVSENGVCSTGCTMSEAYSADIMGDVVFRHDSESLGYETLDESNTAQPWDGFWAPVLPGAAGQRVTLEVPIPLPAAQTPDLSEYQMVFNDEFNGPVLNAAKWNTGLLWGPYVIINEEEQLYVDTLGMHEGFRYDPFSFTAQGTLKIMAAEIAQVGAPPPIPEPDDPIWGQFQEYRSPRSNEPPYVEENVKYLSGIINTYEAFKFTHGYVEARIKIPKGSGLWPAFWMLPTHYVADVPEIDIMENLGQNPNEVYHTYHYFDVADNWRGISTPTYETIGPDFSEDFHVYSVSWDPEQIIWYVDGVEAQRVKSPTWVIPNQAMYLLANVAVGGNWPGSPDNSTPFPAVMELDYIRAYKKEVDRPVDLSQYKLVFEDQFSGSTLDPDKWTTRLVWGPFLTINNEEQHYIDSNGIDADQAYSPFRVAGGNLTITAAVTGTQTPSNTVPPAYPVTHPYWSGKRAGFYVDGYVPKNYTSGIITSRDNFRFTHGYAEIRAKIPPGDGLWPAFWLLNSYYVGRQPEIDVMEIVGENPGQVAHTYHWSGDMGENRKASFRAQGGTGTDGFGDGFHTFGVQWSHDTITWYVDGQETASFTDPDVAYQVMYVIANLAVGGDFNTKPVDQGNLPAELVIDYVKVYQERPLP